MRAIGLWFAFGARDELTPAERIALTTVMRDVDRQITEKKYVAPPGDKTYGRLSVMVQQRTHVRRLFNVPPGAFFPRPRVVSSVLALGRREQPLAPVRDEALFARVVREAFGTRRKMLRRSLGDAFGDETAVAALAAAAVAGTRRPEELSVAEFAAVANALAGEKG